MLSCEEARKLILGTTENGGPFALSRAERGAFLNHFFSCTLCNRWLDEKVAKESKEYPLTIEQEIAVSKMGADLAENDLTDGELAYLKGKR